MKLPRLPFRIPQRLAKTVGNLLFKTKGLKPDICIVGGMILGGSALVVAVVDTWKGKDTLQDDISNVKQLSEGVKNYDTSKSQKVPLESMKADLSKKRGKFYCDIFKTYWKSAALGGTSIILILHGKKLMRHQIVELSAMYASLLESYRRYRKNVIDEYGAEKDQEFLYGVKTVEAIDAETGEVVKKTIVDHNRAAGSRYARWLDEGKWDHANARWIWQNKMYTSNKLELIARIRLIENECNDYLEMFGWMTLNEVYRKLGLPQTEEGQHVGWVKGGILGGNSGDNYIDFHVFDDGFYRGRYQLPINRIFLDLDSHQKAPLLDFNVVCLDDIWANIYEYDNRSMVSYEARRQPGIEGSRESMDRLLNNFRYFGDM